MKFGTLITFCALTPAIVLANCGPSQISLTENSPQYILKSKKPHPSPAQCEWVISAPGPINIGCSMVDLWCKQSYLGINLSGGLKKYCGKQSFTTEIKRNSVQLLFKSSGKNKKNKGYSCVISYTAPQAPTPPPSTSIPLGHIPKPPPCQCGKRGTHRIVGGEEVTPYDHPWQAMLMLNGNSHFCGGSIIHEKWILTAAHCTDEFGVGEITVRVGEHDKMKTEGYEQDYTLKQIVQHENYNAATTDNDISLLELNQPMDLNTRVAPICLPFKSHDVDSKIGTVTGWGATAESASTSNALMEVDLSLLSTSKCREYLPYDITENMICSLEPNKDSCQGDSGGPLIWENHDGNNIQMGIVSWGYGCARPDKPGVYTKLWNYIEWIDTNTGIIGELCDVSGS